MTEQEIIDMAERAGVTVRGHYDESGSTPQELLRFANLVAEREREACAKVCHDALVNAFNHSSANAARQCRDAIRARGEKES